MLSPHYSWYRSMSWVRRAAWHWHPWGALWGCGPGDRWAEHFSPPVAPTPQCLRDLGAWVGGSVITVTCEVGKGCQLGWGWIDERFGRDKRTEKQLPITAHPTKKQMKGQASYQLLVVSPEVRKSRVKRKRSGEMGVREGGKKKRQNCY